MAAGEHDKLLQVQAKGGWVALVPFLAGQEELALNCIASYLTYGKATNYVAYSFEPKSLLRCKQLQMPCYDASALTTGALLPCAAAMAVLSGR